MKYSERQYISYDPFEGERDVKIICRTVKLVKVRKPHRCFEGMSPGGAPHDINPGELARYEAALVDSKWGAWYSCIPCMDAWLNEIGIVPEQFSRGLATGAAIKP